MRQLFEIDTKDYDPTGDAVFRPSVRAIIIRDGKVAMVHSLKYNYYKFPGGGIEPGETLLDALKRETLEETGLTVIPESVQEYGLVHRVSKGHRKSKFVQDNYYFLCETTADIRPQMLDAYEAEEHFTLEFMEPAEAIRVNRDEDHGTDQIMLDREAGVLNCLIREGYLPQS